MFRAGHGTAEQVLGVQYFGTAPAYFVRVTSCVRKLQYLKFFTVAPRCVAMASSAAEDSLLHCKETDILQMRSRREHTA